MAITRVTVTVADFRARFAEFASTSDAIIELALEEALLIHSIRKVATLFCAAHLLSYSLTNIAGGGSGGGATTTTGQISKKSVGPLSVEYETLSGTTTNSRNSRNPTEVAYFAGTTYGQQFLILEQRSPRAAIGALVVG